MKTASLILAAALASSCGQAGLPVLTRAPETLAAPGSEAARPNPSPPCLFVFFPGLGDDAASFHEHGFVDRLRSHGIGGAVSVVETQDYASDDYSTRLHDQLGPHESSRLWLVSVSMGGAAAIRYAATHPDSVEGMILIAPAMGGPFLPKAIENAGGAASVEGDDRDERAVRWLARHRRGDGSEVDVHLAYGSQDALAPFADALAPDLRAHGAHVLVGGGGHSWEVWSELWRGLVDTGFLQRSCGAPRPTDARSGAQQMPGAAPFR